MWRFRKSEWVFIILGIIGVVSMISANPSRFVIPIAVFGVIFLLYKFPPGGRGPRRGHQQRRKLNLRVIRGYKNDDEPPRYH